MKKDELKRVTVSSLPSEIWVSIFRFLDTKSKGSVARVCNSFKDIANCKLIWKNCDVRLKSRNLSLHSERSIIKRGIKRFDVCVLKPRVVEFLHRVPDLEQLRFIGCCVKQKLGEFFDTIPNSAALLRLAADKNDTQRSRLMKDFIHPISTDLYKYHAFNNVSCRRCDDDVLEMFTTGMKQLKVLHLDGCKLINRFPFDDNVGRLNAQDSTKENRLTSLQKLCIRNLWSMTEGTFDYLSQKCFNLVSLSIERCDIVSTEGFSQLPNLKRLEFLSFACCYGITDALLRNVSQLSNLKSLDLGFSDSITDNGLESVSRLTNLMHLNITHLDVTDAGLKHLNKLQRLRHLELPYSSISDTDLSYLAEWNLQLTKLDISFSTKVSDQGLRNICRSKFVLHELDVSGCLGVTDNGVNCIVEKFSNLQDFGLTQCELVSDKAIQLIAAKLERNKNANPANTEKDHDSMILNTDRLKYRLESFLNRCLF